MPEVKLQLDDAYSKQEVDDRIAAATGGIGGNHTHASTQVTDFAEAAQDAVNALLVGASGVSLSYDDTENKLTITGGETAGVDAEAIRDAIGVAVVGVGVITIVVNDEADTITITSTATQNSTDAALRDRATHTGTQTIATIAGLQAALDSLQTQINTRIMRVVYNGTAWPNVPADSIPREFVGGTAAPTDADIKNGDTWHS